MKNDHFIEEFLEFAESVIAESVTTQMWEKYAVNHYADEALEKARREMVETIISFDPKGEGKRLSSEVKERIKQIRNELKLQNT